MRSLFIFALSLGLLAPANASAQDYGGAWDVNTVSQGQALKDSLARKSKTKSKKVNVSAQANACASRAKFRAQYGASNPKVRQLERLCARAGY